MTKKQRRKRKIFRALPDDLALGLDEAMSLLNRRRWVEARAVLEELDRRYANRPEVLTYLVNVNYELNDSGAYQQVCERLLRVEPDDPDLLFSLGSAYLLNARPALALRAFREVAARWPGHERAADAQRNAASLAEKMDELLAELGEEPGAEGLEVALLHEETQSALEGGDYARGRKTGEELLRRRPDFIPVLNNLSQIYFIEGLTEQAIAAAERVLALDPDNFHALSNLTRYLFLSGRADEASARAAQLLTVESGNPLSWLKKAEALGYMGDDGAVLKLFRAAERAGVTAEPEAGAMLNHLAAVALLRAGREDEACKRWRAALRLAPGFAPAQENLDDLKLPVGERHAPWPFDFGNWLPQRAAQDLAKHSARAARSSREGALKQAVARYLRERPEMGQLLPILLERGDPKGREFALRLAAIAQTPETLAALRDFALSQRGPDTMRMEAANLAAEAGLLPAGNVRLWMRGQWQDLMLMGFQIHDEPTRRHRPQVTKILEKVLMLLYEEEGEEAEAQLRRALKLEPDAPDILYNLTNAYRLQGRADEADRLVREIHEQHPDYLFARIAVAQQKIAAGQTDEADALLKPLLALKRIHHSEFAALCGAQIELSLAQGRQDAARSWLELWAGVHPEHPHIAHWRRRLSGNWREKLFGGSG